ncbi:SagB/ThcOx family dehydrogenase [Deltaproteobacteria bacterium IMCC39524]|nr:SagB/ThcOx family dehydrogenase [Deltaproteobacteria bacterium IMCC39524]
MDQNKFAAHRAFLKDTLRLQIDFRQTDQNRGIAPPAIQKPPLEGQELILLTDPQSFNAFAGTDLVDAIGRRRSHRHYQPLPLSLAELSFLLWASQGISEVLAHGSALRNVPSAGCRHAFESYLVVNNVATLERGVYRYLPVEHALVFEHALENQKILLTEATLGQEFIATAPVIFAWTVLPYRMEWRYDLAAHRVIAIDAGHVCQNLYLACEAIQAGTCAIAAYHQEKMDALLQVDGEHEFTLYLAPVGKV